MAKKRARNEKGQLIGDDPSTPDINEAWVEEDKSESREKASKKAKSKRLLLNQAEVLSQCLCQPILRVRFMTFA